MVKIKEIMKKHVITVGPSIDMAAVAKIMTNNRIGSVIVMDKSKPTGIVTTDDIVGLIAHGGNPKKTKISALKKRKKFVTASPDDNMLDVAKVMLKSGLKRIPVVKNGKLEGIVSDKEILTIAPELIDVMSEKLKARIATVALPDQEISGICERCEAYSDDLRTVNGRWWCEDCRES
ncbi:MAG: CBS domain-containing protein [Candidatus Aenigmatarchaeota archaeon]|nr:CBS domain-containing protein [Nanoarchaeota archaeon]